MYTVPEGKKFADEFASILKKVSHAFVDPSCRVTQLND
jgi:hypothetical protein